MVCREEMKRADTEETFETQMRTVTINFYEDCENGSFKKDEVRDEKENKEVEDKKDFSRANS